jgi:hypothetical protein
VYEFFNILFSGGLLVICANPRIYLQQNRERLPDVGFPLVSYAATVNFCEKRGTGDRAALPTGDIRFLGKVAFGPDGGTPTASILIE